MFTVIIIGNSQSYNWQNNMITPRGYYREVITEGQKVGQNIMIESFRTIEKELRNKDIPLGRKWSLLHAIHTTADFDMENILMVDDQAVETLYRGVECGRIKHIITDVTMVVSGIRKGALQRLGISLNGFTICFDSLTCTKPTGAAIMPAGWALPFRIKSQSSINAVGAFPKANIASSG